MKQSVASKSVASIVLAFLVAGNTAWALWVGGDTRPWDRVTRDFVSNETFSATDGEQDGRRLKELDRKRAAEFLVPFLESTQPRALRVRAMGAVGKAALTEAVPALIKIAQNPAEGENIRAAALSPGLRYMSHLDAIQCATTLASDPSLRVRMAAYWVLGQHGTDEAVSVLERRLSEKDPQETVQLLYALCFSKNGRAGRIVFDHTDFDALQTDEHRQAYAKTMADYHVREAEQNMLTLARQRDQPWSASYALRYFAAFPRDDIAPALVAYVEACPAVHDLYDTVIAFIESPEIAKESKEKLFELVVTGKIKKKRRIGHDL